MSSSFEVHVQRDRVPSESSLSMANPSEDPSDNQLCSKSPLEGPLNSESEETEEVSYQLVCPAPGSEETHATQTDDVDTTENEFPEPPCLEPISEVVSDSDARPDSSLAIDVPLDLTPEPESAKQELFETKQISDDNPQRHHQSSKRSDSKQKSSSGDSSSKQLDSHRDGSTSIPKPDPDRRPASGPERRPPSDFDRRQMIDVESQRPASQPERRSPASEVYRCAEPESERRPASESERRPPSESERRPASESERRPPSESERRAPSESERRPPSESERRPPSEPERRPASESERRPASESQRQFNRDSERSPERHPERRPEREPVPVVVKEPTPLPKPRPPPVPPHPPAMSPSLQTTKQRRRSEGLLPQLTHVDHLLIKQRLPIAGLRRNSDFNNKYTLRTILGQDVFRAEEATTLCARDCCGPDRAFHMNIVDLHGRPVIALERPPWLNVCCCCPVLPICQQETRIECPPGVVVGMVREEQTWFGVSPRYAVNDPDGKTLYGVQGPTCPRIACVLDGDVDFAITDHAGMEVGRVSKEWDNLPKELLATSDNFGVSFPEEIPAAHKALLIGVALILDFIYYEREREKYSRNGLSHQMPSIANSRRSSSQHSETSNEVNANFSAWGGGITSHGGTD